MSKVECNTQTNYELHTEKCKKIEFYTSMINVARWLEIELKDYDWHITDIEGAWLELDDPSWVLGEMLSSKLNEFDYQFVWSVISAFPKGTEPFTSNKAFADGNPEFWKGEPKKQIQSALFEIVCWDSSVTLFIGLPAQLEKNLITNAPNIKDLNKENRQR